MKKYMKFVSLDLALVLALCMAACGSNKAMDNAATYYGYESRNTGTTALFAAEDSYYDMDYSDYSDYGVVAEAESYSETVTESLADSVTDTNRKLIRTVNVNSETSDLATLVAKLTDKIKTCGGYIQSMNQYEYSCNMTLRIPASQVDAFLEDLKTDTNMTYHSENVEDVTLTYVDMESHKEMLQVEYDRVLELLERATELSDIITLESRLTEIRYQIESMESQLRTYDNLVDYSTIYLDLREVVEYTQIEEEDPTFWEKLTDNLAENLSRVGNGILNFIIWFVGALPHLLIWGAIIFGIVMLIKGIIKKSRKKKMKKQAQKAQAVQPVPAPAAAPAAEELKPEDIN